MEGVRGSNPLSSTKDQLFRSAGVLIFLVCTLLKLLQEPQIILEDEAQIFDFVAQHDHAI